jgi:hypothetical protein
MQPNKKQKQESTTSEEDDRKYYQDIHIENHGSGTINVTIIQQGQPTPPPFPPKP